MENFWQYFSLKLTLLSKKSIFFLHHWSNIYTKLWLTSGPCWTPQPRNALLLGSVSSGMCSLTMVTMTGRVLICESFCRHKKKDLVVFVLQFPPKANPKPWSLIGWLDRKVTSQKRLKKTKKTKNPKKQPIVSSGHSGVRWWTWKRRRGGAGCGPAGDRAEWSEPRWPPPPRLAASAPSSCPSWDSRGSDIIKQRQQKGDSFPEPMPSPLSKLSRWSLWFWFA